jgi:hypothetical protein
MGRERGSLGRAAGVGRGELTSLLSCRRGIVKWICLLYFIINSFRFFDVLHELCQGHTVLYQVVYHTRLLLEGLRKQERVQTIFRVFLQFVLALKECGNSIFASFGWILASPAFRNEAFAVRMYVRFGAWSSIRMPS